MSEPVFVDPTGRRLARLRMAGRVAGAGFAGYLLMVIAALAGPPGLDRLQVPGLGDVVPAQRAPEVVTTDGDESGAADAVDDAGRRGAPPVTGPAQVPGRTAPSPAPSRGPGSTTGGGTVAPGNGNATPPGSTARPTSAPGKPTASPGKSGAPPGRSTTKPTPAKSPTAKPGKGVGNARAASAAPTGTGP
jgi:hypothetical protein